MIFLFTLILLEWTLLFITISLSISFSSSFTFHYCLSISLPFRYFTLSIFSCITGINITYTPLSYLLLPPPLPPSSYSTLALPSLVPFHASHLPSSHSFVFTFPVDFQQFSFYLFQTQTDILTFFFLVHFPLFPSWPVPSTWSFPLTSTFPFLSRLNGRNSALLAIQVPNNNLHYS